MSCLRLERREYLTVQRNDAPTISVSTITRSGTTATVTTATVHGFISTDYVTIAGAAETAYNGKFKVTVTSTTALTYTGGSGSGTTGTITAVYTSNAQGGQGNSYWRTLDTMWAALVPLRSSERLQMQAIQSAVEYRFAVPARADLEQTMRVLWTPRWPPTATQKTLAITGVIAADADLLLQYLECSEVAA